MMRRVRPSALSGMLIKVTSFHTNRREAFSRSGGIRFEVWDFSSMTRVKVQLAVNGRGSMAAMIYKLHYLPKKWSKLPVNEKRIKPS